MRKRPIDPDDFDYGEISPDVQKRIDKAANNGQIEMTRRAIHQVVLHQLAQVVDRILTRRSFRTEGGDPAKIGKFIKTEDGKVDEAKALINAFIPFFETCALCAKDQFCPIQATLKNGSHRVQEGMASLFPNVALSVNYTLTACGMYEPKQSKIMTIGGWEGTRESVLEDRYNEA